MKIKDHFLTGETFELVETNVKGVYKTIPVPTDLSRFYDSKEYISHHQDSGSLKEKVYKFLQRINLNYKKNIVSQEVPVKGTVLDYGCGAGEFIKYIREDFNVLGFEPNESARKSAISKTSAGTVINDIITIPDQSLNAITLWHVFEHIENQKEILRLFHNKLKDDGVLIIAVPNPKSYDAEYYAQYWAAYDVPRHLFHYTQQGMSNLMKGENWTVEKVKPLLLDSFYISLMSEKYKKSALLWLKGAVIGAISNFKAVKTGEFSSLVYVIKKNK